MGAVWATVRITEKHYETCPKVQCKDCGKDFAGGITRIEDHIMLKCLCTTQDLQQLREKLQKQRTEKTKTLERVNASRAVQKAAEEVEAGAHQKPMVRLI